MATVPNLLKQRWATRNLVGDSAHSCVIRIRQGYMFHQYQRFTMLPTSPAGKQWIPTIWKGHNGRPWQGQWIVTGDWITLTNIQSSNWTRDFQTNGASTLTTVIDNIEFLDTEGTEGLYHVIKRGWFSPTRGVKVVARPSLWPSNDWDNVFNGGYQIEQWEGYGQGDDVIPVFDSATNTWSAPSASKTWVGLIEDCDMESHPDHITLTSTDFTVMLTDQRVIGFNKAKEIQSPITFADRKKTLGEEKTFGSVGVSSGSFTTDDQLGVVWKSHTNSGPDNTEWVQIHIPQGFYRDFYTALPYDGETMYISVYAGSPSIMDGTVHVPTGWVDTGLGNVPSTPIPYIGKHSGTVSDPSRRWSLGGHTFQLGAGSILRISFTDLAKSDGYRAGTEAFYTFKFNTDPKSSVPKTKGIRAKGWILVDDAADVVRTVLMWAGFHEFHVQNFGWTLQKPIHYGQDAFFIDIINDILAQGNFCFFSDAPTDHDMSIGVPTFVAQKATAKHGRGILTIKDTQMAEALQITWDKSNLPYVLRYRGAINKKGTVTNAVADTVKRWTGTYWPPWSGHDYTNLQGHHFKGGFPLERNGGVRRHFSQTNSGLSSVTECLFACILTTIQFALQAVTGSFQIPGRPGLTLNQQVSLVDEGTGTNTRLWVASIDSQHTLGESGAWHMTVGGSIIDTEDMNLIAEDYKYTYKRYVVYKKGQ